MQFSAAAKKLIVHFAFCRKLTGEPWTLKDKVINWPHCVEKWKAVALNILKNFLLVSGCLDDLHDKHNVSNKRFHFMFSLRTVPTNTEVFFRSL